MNMLKNAVIKDTVKRSNGYGNVSYECELKDTPAVGELFNESPIAIAEYLDGAGNFGGRNFSLSKIDNGNLRYRGTIYTD